MAATYNIPTPPDGYFFRVTNEPLFGDMSVDLRKRAKLLWLDVSYSVDSLLSDADAISVRRAMTRLLERMEARQASARATRNLVGDYPPKTEVKDHE